MPSTLVGRRARPLQSCQCTGLSSSIVVQWDGWATSTWESAEHLDETRAVEIFHDQHYSKPGP
jgi:hypothetical protein